MNLGSQNNQKPGFLHPLLVITKLAVSSSQADYQGNVTTATQQSLSNVVNLIVYFVCEKFDAAGIIT